MENWSIEEEFWTGSETSEEQRLGLLLERYGEDDLVVVLSDHGFDGGQSGSLSLTGIHENERALDGVIFAAGPGVHDGYDLRKDEMQVQDVAPTVLTWLGLPLAEDLDGVPASFLRLERRPATVPTYETKPIARVPFIRSEAESQALDEPRQLGYVR